MPYAEDASVFFGPNDPGVVAAYYDGATDPIYGEFKAAHTEPFGAIEGTSPFFWCPAVDVPGVVHGKNLVINSVTYKVRGIQSDDDVVAQLKLEKQ